MPLPASEPAKVLTTWPAAELPRVLVRVSGLDAGVAELLAVPAVVCTDLACFFTEDVFGASDWATAAAAAPPLPALLIALRVDFGIELLLEPDDPLEPDPEVPPPLDPLEPPPGSVVCTLLLGVFPPAVGTSSVYWLAAD